MAKDIKFNLKFDSNGQTVMGDLTMSAKQLANACLLYTSDAADD